MRHLQWVFSPHSQCTDHLHQSEERPLAKMVTLNFVAASIASYAFETTLRCNFGIQLWQT